MSKKAKPLTEKQLLEWKERSLYVASLSGNGKAMRRIERNYLVKHKKLKELNASPEVSESPKKKEKETL